MSVRPLLDAVRDYLSLRDENLVREWFDGFDWQMSERNLPPRDLPGSRHLSAAQKHAGLGEAQLVNTFVELSNRLHWGQTYSESDFGAEFIENYGWVEVFGTRGHFSAEGMAGGLVLFGPEMTYPAHWHVAEEIYFPLTGGTRWMRDDGPYVERASGEFVFHESNESHGMKMGEAPLLALYAWRGGDLTQKSNY